MTSVIVGLILLVIVSAAMGYSYGTDETPIRTVDIIGASTTMGVLVGLLTAVVINYPLFFLGVGAVVAILYLPVLTFKLARRKAE